MNSYIKDFCEIDVEDDVCIGDMYEVLNNPFELMLHFSIVCHVGIASRATSRKP